VVQITLENCLGNLHSLKIGVLKEKNFVKLYGIISSTPLALLDIDIKEAYVPTKGYLKKYSGGDKSWRTPHNSEIYDELKKLLKEEGFRIKYYTEVSEI
jgi:hypothetical protein